MPLTVGELRSFLGQCDDNDLVVVEATLADGSVLGVRELRAGAGQG